MGIPSALLNYLIELAHPEWKREQAALKRRFQAETFEAIAEHYASVSRWSQERHRTETGLHVRSQSIDLDLSSMPRRLGGSRNADLNELDLLLDLDHVVVLGDPGAGKTTTLRRLAEYVVHEAPSDPSDSFCFAVLIICREEDWDQTSLLEVIGRCVGVTGSLAAALPNPEREIRQLLEAGSALVLVDGLDEVPPLHRHALDQQLGNLGRHLEKAKIVASCRSADYKSIESFAWAEILPLSSEQVTSIVAAHLGDQASKFLDEIQTVARSVRDLADRPLFLTQMVSVFHRLRTIPERPLDLFTQVVRLVVEDWDVDRSVRRGSSYAEFETAEKQRFLADLALTLAEAGRIRFTEAELAEAYRELAPRYELPAGQSREVARELEAHNGLLVQVGHRYEFSHLSMQEYLAGDALSRSAGVVASDWWTRYPAVAATAASQSADPNAFLARLVDHVPSRPMSLQARSLNSFLYRLGAERPRFNRSADLGRHFLDLFRFVDKDFTQSVPKLANNKAIRDSVADAISSFEHVRPKLAVTKLSTYDGDQPTQLMSVPTDALRLLLGEDRLRELATE